MKLSFRIQHDEPAFVISDIDSKEIIIGMSIYDIDPIKRLHGLFLMLNSRWLGYSAEEFDDEGQPSALAFTPADVEGFSLMTVDQGDEARLVKDFRISNVELVADYKKAFSDFLSSLSEEQIKEINSQNDLATDYFKLLSKDDKE